MPKDMKVTLKTARELKGYTQLKAAELIGVNVDTLGNYERGKSYPDIPVLRKIEKVYQVPYHRIIFLPLDFGLTEENKEPDRTEVVEQLEDKELEPKEELEQMVKGGEGCEQQRVG